MINSLFEKKKPYIQYKIIWRKQLAVPEKKAEVWLTFAYKSIDKLIKKKEKSPIFNTNLCGESNWNHI